MAKEYNHTDCIGRPLNIGDPVACPKGITTLLIGTVTAVGEKQIRVVGFGEPALVPRNKYKSDGPMKINGKLRYPKECVLLDGPDVTMYLLKWKKGEE